MSLELLAKGASALGLNLDDARLERFESFRLELEKWNRKINLTSIEGVENVTVKHFLDSLTVPAMLDIKGHVLDIGSGAGFPGIPVKIMLPELQLCSVDAVEKKILFQRHVARLLGLKDFTAIHARGESLDGKYGRYFDFIISRAFSDIIKFVNMVYPLLADGGSIIAMKGADGRREIESVKGELDVMGICVLEIKEFSLPVSGDSRSIIVMKKS